MALAKDIFIIAAKRTPFGTFGGKLKNISPTDICVIAGISALSNKLNNINAADINSTIVGNVIHTSPDSIYIGRHAALKLGIPVSTPSLTVNRLCGSGFQSIINGIQDILCNDADIALCGGTENMSQCPYMVRNLRFGIKLGTDLKMEDSLWQGLTDSYVNMSMAITAENLAEKYGISKMDADKYALKSQMRWKKAQEQNVFQDEMAVIDFNNLPSGVGGSDSKSSKGKPLKDPFFGIDEHPKIDTTLENLQKLPAIFKKGGNVSAGNASGICDGGGVVIVTDGETCKRKNYKPLARIVSFHVSGCDPTIMGIGPVYAIKGALKKANLSVKDMDLIEVNEAFASQYLAVEKELNLNPEKTNVNGGAIALGHPLAASGSRIMAHLTHQLRLKNLRYAVGSACIGGGQGIAIVIENLAK
ncbi:unnamed protein product [Gordionus sp. m RMFG-2023]|uniref:3-ketoacyl-CoA thiolase, mitochondrial-like n=1 Tax=Gordionus sp. m RMFG-2023 TaxID=3053472 RepID=UPI0030E4F023